MKPTDNEFHYLDVHFEIDKDFQNAIIQTIKDNLYKLLKEAYNAGYRDCELDDLPPMGGFHSLED